MKYQKGSETRGRLISSVIDLMAEGREVGAITGLAVTEHSNVDKMYVNRYFGDLSGLFVATIEELLTVRLGSMLSPSVFPGGNFASPDPNVVLAFKIVIYLSSTGEHRENLTDVGRIITSVYAQQLQSVFGMNAIEAKNEARLGVMFIAGYLSVGTYLEVDETFLAKMFAGRLQYLRGMSGRERS